MKFKQIMLGLVVGFLTVTSVTPVFAKNNLVLTDNNMDISVDPMYKSVENHKQIFDDNNIDFIIIERATGEIETFVINESLDGIIPVNELNISTSTESTNNTIKNNTQTLSEDMRQTFSINWTIPANQVGYGTSIFNLRVGDRVSYSITPASSANIQVGLYNRNTNTFESYWSHTGIPAGFPVSNNFTVSRNGSYSFGISNNNNYSNQFLGNFSI